MIKLKSSPLAIVGFSLFLWLIIILGGLALMAGCAPRPAPLPPEPIVITKEVNIATPVPCSALAKLGSEPEYADTDAAIAATTDIFSLAKVYSKGRLQRIKRLAEYGAAKASCIF